MRTEWHNAPAFIAEKSELLEGWLYDIAEKEGFKIKRLSYKFCSNSEIQDYNERYLKHNYPTDIITFDYGKRAGNIDAECLIGKEVLEDNARESGLLLMDEYCRVLVHGLLHCLGFDDQTPEQKRAMRKEEEKALILRPKIFADA